MRLHFSAHAAHFYDKGPIIAVKRASISGDTRLIGGLLSLRPYFSAQDYADQLYTPKSHIQGSECDLLAYPSYRLSLQYTIFLMLSIDKQKRAAS